VLAATPGWTAWCPACDWNLITTTSERAEPRTRFERAYVRAGSRIGRRLESQLATARDLEPRWTASKVAAISVALLVHLATLVIAVGGLVLVGRLELPATAVGLLLVAIAWLMRPRLGRGPKEDIVVAGETPELHRLVSEVAAALETRPPHVVVVDEEYNASWNTVGIRRTRVLTLGLPLFDCLGPQERVALVSHELGHGRNGDVRRGVIVYSALSSLSALYRLLAPGSRIAAGHVDPWLRIAEPLANALMYLVTRPLAWLLSLEAHLVWQDSQRAEYLADALAARVAGTDAEIALKERLLESRTLAVVARQAVNRPAGESTDLLSDLRRAIENTPDHERERLRRAARREQTRLDATHPPIARRIELLKRRPSATPAVTLSTAASARIDAELGRRRSLIATRIVDAYRSSLYSGARR
jgi:Zn-dependent protease with chaperone function